MSKMWIRAKMPEFVRDMFRTFCMGCRALEQQFRAFDENGDLSFEILKDLLGHHMDKGLLWRMKDTAHHVLRSDPDEPVDGRFLDWGLGYIYHETVKLKEDAYQTLTYAPLLRAIWEGGIPDAEADIAGNLELVVNQTRESMRREIDRIRFIMAQCRRLLPGYLGRHRDNVLLARFIYARNTLVREVFSSDYDALINGIYGDEPEMLFVLASQSLRLGGWMEEAADAAKAAMALNGKSKLVLQENKIIDNWLTRMKT